MNPKDPELLCAYPGCLWSSTAKTLKDRKSACTRHYNGAHSSSFKYICADCGACLMRQDSLVRHVKACLGSKKENLSRVGIKPAFPPSLQEDTEELAAGLGQAAAVGGQGGLGRIRRDPVMVCGVQGCLWSSSAKTLQARQKARRKHNSAHLRASPASLQEDTEEVELDEEELALVNWAAEFRQDSPSSSSPAGVEAEDGLGEAQQSSSSDNSMEVDLEVGQGQVGVCEAQQEVDLQSSSSSHAASSSVRRSTRVNSSVIAAAELEDIKRKLRSSSDEGLGLTVIRIPGKGLGVVTSVLFKKGSFVVEYAGRLVDYATSLKLHYEDYSSLEGGYIYWFQTGSSSSMAIDATEDSPRFGRRINHSKTSANLLPKTLEVDGVWKLYFQASRDIQPGTELLFDYGDTNSIANFPWLKN